tara:strand:- start:105 stop:536 length:432 start_codon:yes stop_codon:yes gene_type:complete
MKTTDQPVIAEQFFNQSKTTVWNAITVLEQMKQWYFDNIPEFKTEVGFKTQFNVKAPSRDFLHVWTITEVIPFQKIVYNWKFEGLPGSADVTFELFDKDHGTNLIVTNTVIEDFDSTILEFQRESCQAGWNYFINERLKAFLS